MIPYLDFPSNLVGMKASACHRPRPCQTGWTSDEYTLLRLINSNYTISLFWNGHFQFHTPQIWAQNQGWILNRCFYCISGNGEVALERERRMPLYSDVPDINVRGEGGEPNSLWAPYVRRTQICNIKNCLFHSTLSMLAPVDSEVFCLSWTLEMSSHSFLNSLYFLHSLEFLCEDVWSFQVIFCVLIFFLIFCLFIPFHSVLGEFLGSTYHIPTLFPVCVRPACQTIQLVWSFRMLSMMALSLKSLFLFHGYLPLLLRKYLLFF